MAAALSSIPASSQAALPAALAIPAAPAQSAVARRHETGVDVDVRRRLLYRSCPRIRYSRDYPKPIDLPGGIPRVARPTGLRKARHLVR